MGLSFAPALAIRWQAGAESCCSIWSGPGPPRLIDRVSLEMGLGHAGFSSTERKRKNIYLAPPACVKAGGGKASEAQLAGRRWRCPGDTGVARGRSGPPLSPPGLVVQAEQGGGVQGRGGSFKH